jgi:hypothetical protein
LCGEEYYLYKKGWLNKGIWKIWEAELIRTLQTPLFIREWEKLSSEFEAYSAFKEYVYKIRKSQNSNTNSKQPKIRVGLTRIFGCDILAPAD